MNRAQFLFSRLSKEEVNLCHILSFFHSKKNIYLHLLCAGHATRQNHEKDRIICSHFRDKENEALIS